MSLKKAVNQKNHKHFAIALGVCLLLMFIIIAVLTLHGCESDEDYMDAIYDTPQSTVQLTPESSQNNITKLDDFIKSDDEDNNWSFMGWTMSFWMWGIIMFFVYKLIIRRRIW